MASKKPTLKAGKAGNAKTSRNVSSETKVCTQSLAADRHSSYASLSHSFTTVFSFQILIINSQSRNVTPRVARPADTIKGTPEWDFGMKDFLLARAKCNQEKARGLRAQADELEKWWKRDTKEAARHNIEGKKLAEKEGGASSIDDLFEQTCAEMEAEAAEKAEADKPESGETAESEN
ncbi:hypothetical protein FPHYL_4398 [Fusarium phyllophilum]|uniref:Uncharacterized protein n=1 Tax=Fusarium phyllophilum TaxID=47803 RepID=A0A8H5NG84_9HYPO|nr:hypothetical protein FPHYL_4398 [Fusarium phyllophilum]